jgi:hypothetical protein
VTRNGRESFLSPHNAEHVASVEARAQTGIEPRTLAQYIAWYRTACEEEAPMAIHIQSVWFQSRARPRMDGREEQIPAEHRGGSHLGSHAFTDSFRRYTEAGPREVDEDGYYRLPLKAALEEVSHERPLGVRRLVRLAQTGFDVQRMADIEGWSIREMQDILECHLAVLWVRYSALPKARERAA